jgi:membrane protein
MTERHRAMIRASLRSGALRERGRAGLVLRVIWRTIGSLLSHYGLELAGHLAFTAMLALFPFLVFLAALGGLIGGQDVIRTLLDFLFRFAPVDVARTLSTPIVEVLSHRPKGFLTLGLVFAIWAASSGVDALRLTLNRAYGFVERRSIVRLKLLSILAVLIGGGFVFVVAVFVIVGPLLWEVLRWIFPLSMDDERLWILSRYVLGSLLIAGLTAVLHRFLPAHAPKWREILPGAIITSLLILILAGLFADYLADLGSYGATYGALAGVVVTLLFFYLTALIFIFGAELNTSIHRAALRRRARPGPATSDPPGF